MKYPDKGSKAHDPQRGVSRAAPDRATAAPRNFGRSQPAAAASLPSVQSRGRRARDWPLWIVAAFACTALVAAGYLGALVQLGGADTERAKTVHVLPERPEPAQRVESASGAVRPSAAPVEPMDMDVPPPTRSPAAQRSREASASSRAETRAAIAKAAARATAELERELYQRSPEAPATRPVDSAGAGEPRREDVQEALLAMRPKLEACAAGQHGMVDASVSIASSGRVTYSLIRGDFAGTPEGSCMARALREANFQPFSGTTFKVQFPFAL